MSETTVPTGGSNKMKISRTTEDLNKMFGFEVIQMDFQVDKNRVKDEKEGETESTSGNDGGDTSTPIIPGNHQTINGMAYAKVLLNPELIISKPIQGAKNKDNQRKEQEEKTESAEK